MANEQPTPEAAWQCPKCKRWNMARFAQCVSEYDTGIACDGQRATSDAETLSDEEKQRRSFAYGNANISNPNITREIIVEAAVRMSINSGRQLVIDNAAKDPSYCPYCMRCAGLVRMRKIESFYWRCTCGAEHDEREVAKNQGLL